MDNIIVLAEGYVETPNYTGPVTVHIGCWYVPDGSIIAVETRPSDADLQRDMPFLNAVIQVLIDAGRLQPGAYELVPSDEQPEAGVYHFIALQREGHDFTGSFCLEHGAELFEPRRLPLSQEQRRYRYRHRMTVHARSERDARLRALESLPDIQLWSEMEPEHFELDAVSGGSYSLALSITFSADDEGSAKVILAEILGNQVDPKTIVLEELSDKERRAEETKWFRGDQ